MIDASVVICAYTFDRWEELQAAVASARAQTRRPREVFVVVDGNDELLRRARAEIPGADVVPNTNAPGLSGGRVTGAQLASAEVIAFLDDDAVADERWLEELLAAYTDDAVLGAGGHVEPLWRSAPPSWFPAEFNWVVGCTHPGMAPEGGRIRNPIGANMSVRADVLARTGGFAPELGRLEVGKRVSGTADETEFCIRAERLHPGGWWAYRPDARVQHVVAPQRTTWAYFVRRCRLEGAAKAVLTGLTGTDAGLASERRYLRSVLPRAVVRELAAGRVRRAGAIVAGVA
ncbi:MAG TPA: glycosyltransferase family 2 protein, partial [Solirubrobacteraceae bacterium]